MSVKSEVTSGPGPRKVTCGCRIAPLVEVRSNHALTLNHMCCSRTVLFGKILYSSEGSMPCEACSKARGGRWMVEEGGRNRNSSPSVQCLFCIDL